MRKPIRIIAWSLVAIASLTAFALALALALSATEWGRGRIVATLNDALREIGDYRVVISDLQRLSPTGLQVGKVAVSQGDRPLVLIGDLSVRWNILDLVRGPVRIEAVRIAELHLSGLPEGGEQDQARATFRLPRPPVLPLGELRIERLRVSPPVIAQELDYVLTASERHEPSGAWTLALSMTPVQPAEDRLEVALTLDPRSDRLALHLDFLEAAGGPLARIAGLAKDAGLSARLKGEGPASAWRGHLSLAADGLAKLDGSLLLRLAENPAVDMEGRVILSDKLQQALGGRFGEAIDYRALVAWRRDKLAIDDLALAGQTLDINIRGMLAPESGDLDLSGRLRVIDLARMIGPQEKPTDGMLDIDLALSGNVSRPEGRFAVGGWIADGGSGIAGDVEFDGTLSWPKEPASSDGFQVATSGRLHGLQGLPDEARGFVGRELTFAAKVASNARIDEIRLSEFVAQSQSFRVSGDGLIDLASTHLALGLALEVADLAPGLAAFNLGARGAALGNLAAAGSIAPLALDFDASFGLRDFALREAALAQLAGRTPNLTVRGSIAEDRKLVLDAVRLLLRAGEARVKGILDLAGQRADLRAQASMPELAILSQLSGRSLRGAAKLEMEASGPIAAPRLDGRILVSDLTVDEFEGGDSRTQFTLSGIGGEPKLGFALEGAILDLPLFVSGSTLLRRGQRLGVILDEARFGSLTASGSGETRLDTGLTDARMAIELDPDRALPLPGGRALKASSRLDLVLAPRDGGQAAMAELTLGDLVILDGTEAMLRLGALQVSATGADLLQEPTAKIALTAVEAELGQAFVEIADLRFDGGLNGAKIEGEAKGRAGQPIALALALQGALADGALRFDLTKLVASYGQLPLRLVEPASFELGPERQRLGKAVVQIDGGRMELEGELTPDKLALQMMLAELPVGRLAALAGLDEVSGRLDAEVRLGGAPDRVSLVADARLREVRAKPDLPALSATVKARTENERFDVRGDIIGLAEAPLTIAFDMPMRLSLAPAAAPVSPDAAISGRLSGPLELERLAPLITVGEDRLTGHAMVDLRVSGTAGKPAVSGSLSLEGGSYESALSATRLRDIKLDLRGDGGELTLKGSALDGDGGRLAIDGAMQPDRAGLPLSASLKARDLWVARRDDARIKADADLTLSGALDALDLAGEIAILQADIAIPESLPPSVATIDVIEINRPGRKASADPKAEGGLIKLDLGLTVKAQNRVFVRGRGLESEWGGDLAIAGSAAEPEISGQLNVLRGQVDLLGKRFVFQRGRILFPGGPRIDPLIDAVAEASAEGLTAEVRVSGSLEAPDIALSSRPELPQDEILARVMFGRGTGQLTPIQALQVADSAATLSGRGGGTGVFGRLRQAAGLDLLDVQAGEQGMEDSRLSAGKYLTDDVLLKVEQGLSTSSSRVGVEVELTPNISVETKVGPDAGSELGVNFKIDY